MYATVVKHNRKSNTIKHGETVADFREKIIISVIRKDGQTVLQSFKKCDCSITYCN